MPLKESEKFSWYVPAKLTVQERGAHQTEIGVEIDCTNA
jgi:hypothetical protein